LGIPLLEAPPEFSEGSLDTEVKCPYKEAALRSLGSLALGLARQILVYENRPSRFLCKLNLGFSGKGNAMVSPSLL